MWIWLVSAFAGTTAVLVNTTEDPLEPEFVLIGREVCDACSEAPLAPGEARAMEVGDATRLIMDIVGPSGQSTLSLRFGTNGRSSSASGSLQVQQIWSTPTASDGVVVLLVSAFDHTRRRASFGSSLPSCGSMVDELRGCRPTVCQASGKDVTVESLDDGACVLSLVSQSVGRGASRVLRCRMHDDAARTQVVDVFREASSTGRWPYGELDLLPVCEETLEANPAQGEHRIVWINDASVPVQLGGLGPDCVGCGPRTLAPGEAHLAMVPAGTPVQPVPIGAAGLDLWLDLSVGMLHADREGSDLTLRVDQDMDHERNTLSTVRFGDR